MKDFYRKNLYRMFFDYSEKQKNACVNMYGYDIRLPLTKKELFEDWEGLDDRFDGYEYGKIAYGFFRNNKLRFFVEIRDDKIYKTVSAYWNRDIHKKQEDVVNCWHKKYFLN